MRRYFGLLFEHQAMNATNTRATAKAAARPTAEEMVMLGIFLIHAITSRRSEVAAPTPSPPATNAGAGAAAES